MIILGIDPGTSIVGYAALNHIGGGSCSLVAAGSIEPTAKNNAAKLAEIRRELLTLIDIHSPGLLALEKIFFSKNIRTAMQVAEARGVILLTAHEKGIRVVEYTPSEVKTAVCGYGKADKQQVQRMIKLLLRMEKTPKRDDASDAIAIAFTALKETSPLQTA